MLEKGIVFDVRYDVPWGSGTCTPDYSPLEQLPILIAGPDTIIYDSVYICDWLEACFPEPPLLPAERDARLFALKHRMLGERLMEVAQALIFELHRLEPSLAWVDRQTRKVAGALAELDRIFAEHPVANDAVPDLGHIAVATTVLGIEFAVASGLGPDIPVLRWRDQYPALAAMVSAFEQRPAFVQTRPQMMDVNLQATVA